MSVKLLSKIYIEKQILTLMYIYIEFHKT